MFGFVATKTLMVKRLKEILDKYKLLKFIRSNQGTCYNQRPIVSEGDEVVKGEILSGWSFYGIR